MKSLNALAKRTKIITTIGPSSSSEEKVKELFFNGMTTIRCNFSHGDFAEQGPRFEYAKKIRKDLDMPISILLDTKGPEIRVSPMKDGKQEIKEGTLVTINCVKHIDGTNSSFSVTDSTGHYNMANDLSTGSTILVDDGKLLLITKSVDVKSGVVTALAQNTHLLKTNKRINLPGSNYSMPFLSDKDIHDIEFAVKNKVDYIAASFVNSKANVLEIRKLLKKLGGDDIQIISKVETQKACDNLDEIIESSDGIMVARGDLGLEVPYQEVPYWQLQMVKKCRNLHKPVIIATQMLDSMEKQPLPTRAEVTDVYFAVSIGSDSTMLSGETANGDHPVLACSTMTKINKRAEEIYNYSSAILRAKRLDNGAISKTAAMIAEKVYDSTRVYDAVIVPTNDRALIQEISAFRPNTIILGVTSDERMYTAFGIYNSIWMNLGNVSKVDAHQARNLMKKYNLTGKGLLLVNDKLVEI